MRDPATLPLLTPELLLGTDPLPPPPPGPVCFAVDHWPEREQPTLVRECFARLGFKYDIERLPDVPADRIFEEVLRIRPQAWPNLRILEIGDAMLGRRGELVAAAAGVYRTQLDGRPYLAEQMRSGGRGREIETAMR